MNVPDTCCEGAGFHPLELIPFFRRLPPSRLRNLAYTAIWNVMIAAAMLVAAAAINGRLPTARMAGIYLVLANFAGFAIHALFEGGRILGIEALALRHGLPLKTLYYTVVPTLGMIAGLQATDWVLHIGFANWFASTGWIVSIIAASLILSLMMSLVFYAREREASAQAHSEQIRRETLAANLRALQAQIEPHFLFNTLANVSSLIDRDPAAAKRMLERFIGFLRASLAATRSDTTTLGAERELIGAYLDVLRVRMGARLQYGLEVPDDVAGFSIAPMLLQPVVENAIRHGIEPKVEGGRVEFEARRAADAVVIEIRDTGVGFAPATRGGVGLTNLRDRLRGLYGE
ncbi:MAG TPA: histidine kinase, partial [Usitatibacter sp.]|nr:histidine kinase [Usitatibacter sp.]